MFRDRTEAGRALAAALAPLIVPPCVVAAIPRGGVAVALPIVERLRVPLTIVYARKLSAPLAPELAFGALDEDGQMTLDPATVAWLKLGPEDIRRAKAAVWAEIQRGMSLYGVVPLAGYLPGSTVVLADDGLATGLTMRAALLYARRRGAREVIVATPCAAAETAEHFRRAADRFVALTVDAEFSAVGGYYRDFSPVSDDQVLAILARARDYLVSSAPRASGLLVSFKNSRGFRLAGRLLVPASGGPHPCAVFAHGWQSGKDSPRNRGAAEALRAAGFAAFLFDFTGHGESEGTREEGTPIQHVDDLGAALDILETLEEVDASRIGVVGASSGAAAALLRAAEDARIRALVLRSGNPEGAGAAAGRVTVPTLLVVGEHDGPTRGANEALLARLGGSRRLEVVAGADHLFGDPAALRQAIDLIVAWFKAHLADSGAEGAG
ncbi:MAG: alpha/beta fold hydrolase [Candidatus Rokubacteria bacterium]|nr:alpha/beta fold hydrolase [Candidatus Rokubacteria bacterium]